MNRHRMVLVLLVVMLVAAPAVMFAFEEFDSYPGFSYDVGVSSGYSGDAAFYELNAALNTHINPWATWRNSVFYRGEIDDDAFYGLDTSVQLGRRLAVGERTSFLYQGGGGYRFTSLGKHAPFAEAGVGLQGQAWRLGLNAKYVLYELVGGDRDNEIMIGIVASGALSGRF